MKENKRFPLVLLVIIIIALPLLLIGIKQTLNNRSNAAAADKLETEGGTLSSSGVTTQSDTTASGGQYVLFQNQTSSPTPTNSPTSGPTPTSVPSTGGVYGPGIGMNSLANTNLGGSNSITKVTMRFRADNTSALTSFRTYIQSYDHPGYGGGNGGTIKITLQSDDGTSNHFPSSTVLATAPNIVNPVSTPGRLITFSTSYNLTKGTFYHIVFENIDPSPGTNYFSGNYLYNPTTPNQPKYGSPTEWGHAYYSGSSSSWVARTAYSPILDLTYSNGAHQGMGYMELGSIQKIGGANSIRQKITPTSTRTISQVSVRVRRTSGSSPLVLSIGNQTVNVPSSSSLPAFPAVRAGDGMTWVSVTLPSPVTLSAGQTYYLTLSAASGTEYSTDGLRKGSGYGYHASTTFADGYAEKNTGSGWSGFPSPWDSTPTTEADLQWWAQ